MIISTTDLWSKHAEDALSDQHITVTRLRVQDLNSSGGRLGLVQPEGPHAAPAEGQVPAETAPGPCT
jgi:hypothetical protein